MNIFIVFFADLEPNYSSRTVKFNLKGCGNVDVLLKVTKIIKKKEKMHYVFILMDIFFQLL